MSTPVPEASEPDDRIDPRRLLIFREVARRGSLSAAAAALGWTQPAVGQHVQRLERDVGLPLALRTSRGVTLTEAGTVLLGHADALASRLASAADEMRSLRALQGGTLRLAAFPSACATLLPALLVALADSVPLLQVRVTELEPPESREAVLAGDLDLALTFDHRNDAPEAHRDLVRVRLLEDPVLAVLPAGHELAARPPVDLAALAGERWIAGCERCRTHLTALARAAGFVPDVHHETDDYVVVQNLVAAGLAVALLPRLALTASRNQGVVAVRLAGDPVREVALLHRHEAAGQPSVRRAVEALTALAARSRP